MSRYRLYPPIEPFNSGYMKPDGLHEVYYEEVGNPNGIPVMFLHGGPGAGCGPVHRRFFDPQKYRVVLMDQRGCGRSKPLAEIKDNTTQNLISDIEQLRNLLHIDRWVVFGGSWGATLSLAYAQAHPERALAVVLRGVFLGRPSELDWFFEGIRNIFPEAQQELMSFLPEEERENYLQNYYRRLCDPDPAIHGPAADTWAKFEARCVLLEPNEVMVQEQTNADAALAISRLEAHYMINDLFLKEAPILENMHKIKDIPGFIVQGRYDAICPPVTAWEVHKAWPKSQLIMLNDAGHSASEPSITRNLVKIMDYLKTELLEA
ncbi:MAG: prolyl aminopeptidase [Alphaproteobacteria bacterium]|nr:prolyl aminopeptidase [Alphaproteobacteria bacterium]